MSQHEQVFRIPFLTVLIGCFFLLAVSFLGLHLHSFCDPTILLCSDQFLSYPQLFLEMTYYPILDNSISAQNELKKSF